MLKKKESVKEQSNFKFYKLTISANNLLFLILYYSTWKIMKSFIDI
jgi:hypothetical protein